MIDGEVQSMNISSVSDIMQRGGTIIHTARSEEFKPRGSGEGSKDMREFGIEGLIVIGGWVL